MVQKEIVRNWHREEFAAGRKEGIPPEALRILEADAAARKTAAPQEKAKTTQGKEAKPE